MAKVSSPPASVTVDGATIHVSGRLTKDTVARILVPGRKLIAARPDQVIALDLGDVSSADSAGLALIVDWLRTALAHKATLRLQGVPEQLGSIAAISGLEPLIAGGVGDAPG